MWFKGWWNRCTYSSTQFLVGLTYIANRPSLTSFSARYGVRAPPRLSTNMYGSSSDRFHHRVSPNTSYGGILVGHKLCRLHRGRGWKTWFVEPTKLTPCASGRFPGGTPLFGRCLGCLVSIRHSRSARRPGETFPSKSILTRRGLE